MTILLSTALASMTGFQPSVKYNDAGSLWPDGSKTIYVTGSFTSGAAIQVQISPDPLSLADASSRWQTLETWTAPGYLSITDKWKKIRAGISVGGLGSALVEIL